jgi:kynurenine formamidase
VSPASDRLLDLLADGLVVVDLGRPLQAGMPQSADHPQFRMVLGRRHGDLVRTDGSSGANETIVTGGHVGTHIDALAHISADGRLHGGLDARETERGGRFRALGAETIPPLVRRCVLLDLPALGDGSPWPPDADVPVPALERALDRAPGRPAPGDVILIRTGWGRHFGDRERFEGAGTGTPGVGPDGARWLAGFRPIAVGSDTIAFERLTPPERPVGLPVHRILIVEHGIHVIETLDLEGLAATGTTVFTLVLAGLPLVGATGAPARPLALIDPRARAGDPGP